MLTVKYEEKGKIKHLFNFVEITALLATPKNVIKQCRESSYGHMPLNDIGFAGTQRPRDSGNLAQVQNPRNSPFFPSK